MGEPKPTHPRSLEPRVRDPRKPMDIITDIIYCYYYYYYYYYYFLLLLLIQAVVKMPWFKGIVLPASLAQRRGAKLHSYRYTIISVSVKQTLLGRRQHIGR